MIAIGPVSKAPSWQWVGLDTIKELSKYFHVEIFNNFTHLPKSKIILIIKQLPTHGFVRQAVNDNKKIIYCPIDYFDNLNDIHIFGSVLSLCTIILSHAESLIPIFKKFAPTFLIEHNGKFTLPQMATYKKEGYVLWIGGYQFVPFLLQYLNIHHFNFDLKLLTDYKKKNAIGRANSTARELGISLNTKHLEMYEWNEELQVKMMQECKAAIDIKGNTFSQQHKPPTKGQKYIASGIPFAINTKNNCYNYFKSKGFNICSPDEDRWFSKEYWAQTRDFAKYIRQITSIEDVGKNYCQYIQRLVVPEDKPKDGIGLILSRYV